MAVQWFYFFFSYWLMILWLGGVRSLSKLLTRIASASIFPSRQVLCLYYMSLFFPWSNIWNFYNLIGQNALIFVLAIKNYQRESFRTKWLKSYCSNGYWRLKKSAKTASLHWNNIETSKVLLVINGAYGFGVKLVSLLAWEGHLLYTLWHLFLVDPMWNCGRNVLEILVLCWWSMTCGAGFTLPISSCKTFFFHVEIPVFVYCILPFPLRFIPLFPCQWILPSMIT